MKIKFTQIALCVATLSAIGAANADVYYGLGYTQNTKSDRVEAVLRSHLLDQTLAENFSPTGGVGFNYETNDGITAMIGFPVKNNFAIEARYTYFTNWIDSNTSVSGMELREYEATDEAEAYSELIDVDKHSKFQADAHKIGLHGVYRHSLNSFIYAKGAAGVTFTTSDLNGKFTKTSYTEEGETVDVENKDIKNIRAMGIKVKRDQLEVEATVGLGFRITSRINMELDYNASKHQETATAQVVWRW